MREHLGCFVKCQETIEWFLRFFLFQVDEIYTVPEVGTVVGGTLYRSVEWNVDFHSIQATRNPPDLAIFLILQWYLPRGRSSCSRTHRVGSVPQVDCRQHPEEPLGMPGTQGRPGRHSCSGKLWPIAAPKGQTLDLLIMISFLSFFFY